MVPLPTAAHELRARLGTNDKVQLHAVLGATEFMQCGNMTEPCAKTLLYAWWDFDGGEELTAFATLVAWESAVGGSAFVSSKDGRHCQAVERRGTTTNVVHRHPSYTLEWNDQLEVCCNRNSKLFGMDAFDAELAVVRGSGKQQQVRMPTLR